MRIRINKRSFNKQNIDSQRELRSERKRETYKHTQRVNEHNFTFLMGIDHMHLI